MGNLLHAGARRDFRDVRRCGWPGAGDRQRSGHAGCRHERDVECDARRHVGHADGCLRRLGTDRWRRGLGCVGQYEPDRYGRDERAGCVRGDGTDFAGDLSLRSFREQRIRYRLGAAQPVLHNACAGIPYRYSRRGTGRVDSARGCRVPECRGTQRTLHVHCGHWLPPDQRGGRRHEPGRAGELPVQ